MLSPSLRDYTDIENRVIGRNRQVAPTVTLVTVCLNAVGSIGRTISSVRRQDYDDYEHIIVDGASTDGTNDLARTLIRPQDLLLSEPDRGISDAMNKGIALARGRFIQFIHADDWMSRGQLRASVAAIEATGADYVFGDLLFFRGDVPEFLYRGTADYGRAIHRRCPALNHPTVLARRAAFERIGLFSLQYCCAMDYDWFLRLHRRGGRGIYAPAILGCMNHDGVSNKAFWRTMLEVRDIAINDGRSLTRANLECGFRIAKTTFGRAVRATARPVYNAVRRQTNQSFQPLDSTILDRAHP
jgi:glycosyltransferase